MNEVSLDHLCVESRYSKAVAEMSIKLKEIGGDYDRIIFPGHSASVLWEDLKMAGGIDKSIQRKVKTITREPNKEMYGTEFSAALRKKRCSQAVGRAKKILIIDDMLDSGTKLLLLHTNMSNIDIAPDFLILVSKKPEWAQTIIISHDQDIRKALESRI